jgi:hypothetical protein
VRLQFFKALARKFQFAIRRLLRFLDKRMKHGDSLTNHETVKRSTYALATAWTQFEEAIAKRTRMR